MVDTKTTPASEQINKDFANRLYKAMTAKKLRASDLAAAVWGRTTDSRGYDVARNRDRISVYLDGRATPTKDNLDKMAAALGVKPEDLAPDTEASRIERQNPEISLVTIAGHSDRAALRVNTVLPMAAALAIAKIVDDAKGKG